MRYAFRQLAKTPGFSVVAISMIALGIAANTAVFSFIEKRLLRPWPLPDGDRIVVIYERDKAGSNLAASADTFLRWQELSRSFEHLGWLRPMSGTISLGNGVERVMGSKASRGLFPALGFRVQHGRSFLEEDFQPGRGMVTVLSHRFWRDRFNSDPAVLGRTLSFNRVPHTIIGVLTPESTFDYGQEQVWTPSPITPGSPSANERGLVFGRLISGVSRAAAGDEMNAVARQLAREMPGANRLDGVNFYGLDHFSGGTIEREALLMLLASVAAVQLIVCVNLANLLLARALARRREVAVRVALGASPGRLIRQFLGESLLLSAAGGALGILFAWWLAQAILPVMPAMPDRLHEGSVLNARVLAFGVLASVVTGILFGFIPAWQATRLKLSEVMNEGGRADLQSRRGRRIGQTLVIGEIAIALVLIFAAGLLAQSFARLRHKPLGFDSRQVAMARLVPPEEPLRTSRETIAYYDEVLRRIAALPGVAHVAVTSRMVLYQYGAGDAFAPADRPVPPVSERPRAQVQSVSPDYHATLGITIRRGRVLSPGDRAGAARVVLINQHLADKFFPGVDPIGRRIVIELTPLGSETVDSATPWEIVGVTGNVRRVFGDEFPAIYVPLAQHAARGSLLIRAHGQPAVLAGPVRQAVREFNADTLVEDFRPLEAALETITREERNQSWMLMAFGGIALVLAALGIYGVVAYQTAQRTRDFGVRLALGAQRRDILQMILAEGARVAGVGIVLGALGSLVAGRLMDSLLYDVAPYDPWSLAAGALVLFLVALAACWIPARRATRVDPAIALRAE